MIQVIHILENTSTRSTYCKYCTNTVPFVLSMHMGVLMSVEHGSGGLYDLKASDRMNILL